MNSINNTRRATKLDVKKMVVLAMFSTLAFLSVLIFKVRVEFLTFDAKDAIITTSGLFFGPLASLVVSLITAFLEMVTISSTGLYGFVMNFLSSAAFSCTAAIVYKYRRKMSGAVIGLSLAIVAMTAVMMAANILITPLYMKAPRSVVIDYIPKLLLPFNLVKATLNACITLFIYKYIGRAMRSLNIIPKSHMDNKSKTLGIVVTCLAVAGMVVCVMYMVMSLGGSMIWFKK